jgi:hypothetical protein
MTEDRPTADVGLRSMWTELNIRDIEEQPGSSPPECKPVLATPSRSNRLTGLRVRE